MGRGLYDTTDPTAYKSSAGAEAIQGHKEKRAEEEAAAAEVRAVQEYQKLVKSKKSRGLVAARKAEKEAAASAVKVESEGDSDATVKPTAGLRPA